MGIIYVKKCLGKDEQEINIYKFRTMKPQADREFGALVSSGARFDSYGKMIDDPRIPNGLHRFMRQHWIDELPQLYNLARGDIKLVGIRPMIRKEWERNYSRELMIRALKQKPGLFGIQYAFEKTDNFPDKVKCMEKYLDDFGKNPAQCDTEYLGIILKNIILNGNRSS
jgi:lipopolysaccharide/colanic/teichoic acid biosynthesis glycosyltransferase